jgi:hypothetical protein
MNAVVQNKYRGTVVYDKVKAELITAARYRGVITYEDVAALMGIFTLGAHLGKETGQVLGDISEDEHRAGRPMLSALAVSVNGKPGPGFAGLALDLGLIASEADWERFWRKQCEEVYKLWATERNRG